LSYIFYRVVFIYPRFIQAKHQPFFPVPYYSTFSYWNFKCTTKSSHCSITDLHPRLL